MVNACVSLKGKDEYMGDVQQCQYTHYMYTNDRYHFKRLFTNTNHSGTYMQLLKIKCDKIKGSFQVYIREPKHYSNGDSENNPQGPYLTTIFSPMPSANFSQP